MKAITRRSFHVLFLFTIVNLGSGGRFENAPSPEVQAELLFPGVAVVSTASRRWFDEEQSGTVTVMSYNVAGLPEAFSKSRPATNIPLIAQRIDSAVDLLLVQEDFCYHSLLAAPMKLPIRSVPQFRQGCTSPWSIGDGLTTFSWYELTAFERVPWESCYGYLSCKHDCLGTKGFSRSRVALARDVQIDVYNLHADSGSCEGDYGSRAKQFAQLAQALEASSHHLPVIVGGDLNLGPDRRWDSVLLRQFLEYTGLTDTCQQLGCNLDLLDKVLIRSGGDVELKAVRWSIPDGFAGLSDHMPVEVEIEWRRLTH